MDEIAFTTTLFDTIRQCRWLHVGAGFSFHLFASAEFSFSIYFLAINSASFYRLKENCLYVQPVKKKERNTPIILQQIIVEK